MRVAWIGLGTMGAAMATHLVRAGHGVVVYNRTAERTVPLVELGAARAETPAEAADGATVVFTCVSDSSDVEQVVLGRGGAAERMAPGSVLVDCSTISPTVTRRVAAELADRGVGAVDAPVSGGSEGALKGTLTAFVGGEETHVEIARPALEAFCATITHLGPPGAGQAAKAVNQVLIAGTYATLGEALVLGEKEGLPMDALVAALSAGAAQSWVLTNRSRNVIADDYPLGFRVELHLKDLRIALDEAKALGLPMEITRLITAQEERLVDAGLGGEDVSSLARMARRAVADTA
jgi:3-hydroxyisobutyrate dehydrogenase-like beta-hydroxyacid dehydrogenase